MCHWLGAFFSAVGYLFYTNEKKMPDYNGRNCLSDFVPLLFFYISHSNFSYIFQFPWRYGKYWWLVDGSADPNCLSRLWNELVSLWVGSHIFSSYIWVPMQLASQTMAASKTFQDLPKTDWSTSVKLNLSLYSRYYFEFKLGSRML